ncbi:IQ domain-containing protein IQM6 [Senna tora]|uniref:IQ domain-containing protein IQM6 n=1 Tax=Senna tora TaxID=362788 RepID=A0A834TB44_9FABA|nr:IQ domain-containing protein IQM6 [Senna tora]
MMLEGALNLKGRELETVFSFKTPRGDLENDISCKSLSIKNRDNFNHLSISSGNISERNLLSPLPQTPYATPRDEAATRLQKVYKSFRIRRQLADCAVLAEQRWWKALDFAELKRSSISFFDIDKPETAISRWSRARKRAAKVGKGLSKDLKARKLALQHWLEAIDPRHRYGHNLQFYYVRWLHCDSNQPFFYWLDIGEGKEINHERCPRSRLLQQCIKYLGPAERKAYEVVIENGLLFYERNGQLVETTPDAKWIFVLSTSRTLYIGEKMKGTFQHSSFLAGGATLSAGRLVVEGGVIKAVWAHSGHYLPTEENFQEFLLFLKEHGVDLTDVEEHPCGFEEEDATQENKDLICRDNPSQAELPRNMESSKISAKEISDLRNENSNAKSNSHLPLSRLSRGFRSKLWTLEIPRRYNVSDIFARQACPPTCYYLPPDSLSDGYETAEDSGFDEEEYMVSKVNLFVDDHVGDDNDPILREKILKRIDSHKGMKSYQLGCQLATRWTTGAGPRIGCMRDYPSELQLQILEQQNLSPRERTLAPIPSPRVPSISRFGQKS